MKTLIPVLFIILFFSSSYTFPNEVDHKTLYGKVVFPKTDVTLPLIVVTGNETQYPSNPESHTIYSNFKMPKWLEGKLSIYFFNGIMILAPNGWNPVKDDQYTDGGYRYEVSDGLESVKITDDAECVACILRSVVEWYPEWYYLDPQNKRNADDFVINPSNDYLNHPLNYKTIVNNQFVTINHVWWWSEGNDILNDGFIYFYLGRGGNQQEPFMFHKIIVREWLKVLPNETLITATPTIIEFDKYQVIRRLIRLYRYHS